MYQRTAGVFLISGVFLIYYFYVLVSNMKIEIHRPLKGHYPKTKRCHDSLNSLTKGTWEINIPLKESDVRRRRNLDMVLRTRKGWPRYLYHGDLRCGPHFPLPRPTRNKSHPYMFDIQAQCPLNSSTPCCNNKYGWCGNGAEYCECPYCTDYRSYIPAELAQWKPSRGCQLKQFTRQTACDMLNNFITSLEFVGDSLVRHVFTAMLLILTGDYTYGGLKANIKAERKELCKYESQFADSMCHANMAMSWEDVRRNSHFCDGKANFSLSFTEAFNSDLYPLARNVVTKNHQRKGSFIFLGIGIHDNFKTELIIQEYLKPLIKNYTKSNPNMDQWPRLVWSATHAAGPLKPIFYHKKQGNHVIKEYNRKLNEFCRRHGISVFDTFDMTKGVESYDGTHYGYGVNIFKAQILLNFIEEQTEIMER